MAQPANRPNKEYNTVQEIIQALEAKGEFKDMVYIAKSYTIADLIRDLKKTQ